MCPACLSTVVLMAASAVSSGGVVAVLVNKFLATKGEKQLSPDPKKTNH